MGAERSEFVEWSRYLAAMFEVLSAPGEICGHPAAQLSYIGSAEGQQMEYMCDLSNFLHTVGVLSQPRLSATPFPL